MIRPKEPSFEGDYGEGIWPHFDDDSLLLYDGAAEQVEVSVDQAAGIVEITRSDVMLGPIGLQDDSTWYLPLSAARELLEELPEAVRIAEAMLDEERPKARKGRLETEAQRKRRLINQYLQRVGKVVDSHQLDEIMTIVSSEE